MAEEITYIPYGQNEISQQDLMTNLANGLPSFMQQYKWLQKPKNQEKFLQAYEDITKNLVGASDSTGRWVVNANNIDVSGMSPKDREIYEHAAYYIQQQMSRMTPRTKEEEKKKEDLDKFDFVKSFNTQLLNNYYGGNSSLFADSEQGWNSLDARGSNGLRGTDKRRERMIEALETYKKGLEGKNFNFEGTSFSDINDANTKIQAAIDALRTSGEEDDLKAFSALGLPYKSYFSNGGNDPYTKGDYNGTYQGYNDYLAKQEQEKQKAEQEKLKAQQANYWKGFRTRDFSKFNGRPLTAQESNVDYLNQLFAKPNLTGDEASQIVSAFKLAEKNGQLVPLSKEELAKLNPNIWGNRAKYLKKINGMTTPLYYDTLNKQFKLFHGDIPQTSFQDILDQNNPEAIAQQKQLAEQKKLNTPRGKGIELTDADKRDIYATLADLGAVVNPEVFTGTAMALSASGARTWNSIEQKGLWDTLTDWKTWADWGTGALGGVTLLGDASSAVKAVRTFGKLMTVPAVLNALSNVPEAKAAWDKINLSNPIESAKKLTPQDYHALSSFLIGVVSGKNYVKGNLAERKVLQKSGINTQAKTKRREYANKIGLTRTKPSNQSQTTETPTLKIQKTGEDGKVLETKEIQITQEQKNALQSTKADKVNERAKELLGEKIPEGFKVQTTPTNWRTKIKDVKSVIGQNNSEIFGKQTTKVAEETPRQDKFESWISQRSKWDQYKPWSLGTNSNLRRVRNNIFGKDFDKSGLISSASGEESPYAKKPLEQKKVQGTNHIEGLPNKSNARESSFNRAIMNRYRKVMEGKFSNKEMQGGKESVKIGNEDVRVYTSKDAKGNNSVFNVTVSGKSHNFKTQEEAKKFIATIVKQQKNNITSGKITKENVKEIGKVLQNLKRKGWLKQGGQINSLDKVIEDFINNNI